MYILFLNVNQISWTCIDSKGSLGLMEWVRKGRRWWCFHVILFHAQYKDGGLELWMVLVRFISYIWFVLFLTLGFN